ncbi:NAD(P)/FAD-dependent oxidoreductase [Crocinitomix catalasitica]|nr:NAD(P)/FAD-dependent oxidoreductase [Crocinitomix catalasitica]
MAEKLYAKFDPDFDFSETEYIVVGSGLGGLTTAVFLAKSGKKVVVLERHYVPGGFSHTFKRKQGFEWDVGIHYVGGMQEDSTFSKVSDYLTGGRLQWESMGDIYDQVRLDEKKYDFLMGEENLRKQFHSYFPENKSEIDRYLKLIRKVSKAATRFFVQKALPPVVKWLFGWQMAFTFKKYSKRTTYEVLSKITKNRDLINLLCGQCGDYGLPPKESSFGVHAAIVNHFLEGGFYPVGGAARIHEGMIEEIVNNGGTVFVRAEVEEILVNKNKVKGVKINGLEIPCCNVISNVGIRTTFERLVSRRHLNSRQLSFQKIKPSHAHFCLYVGLNKSDLQLDLPRHNVWYYDGDDMDEVLKKILSREEKELRFAYISFPSAKDPDWVQNHGETATLQAVGISSMEWFKDFEETEWMDRGQAYEEIKADFEDRMLAILYKLFPQLKGSVAVTEVSSPLSTKHFTNHLSGEIYGLAHSPERYSLKCLEPKSGIKGLYMCGQDITTVGFGGAVASGLICATHLLKFSMYRQFKSMGREKASIN